MIMPRVVRPFVGHAVTVKSGDAEYRATIVSEARAVTLRRVDDGSTERLRYREIASFRRDRKGGATLTVR